MGTKAKARQTERRNLAKAQRADSLLRKNGRYAESLALKKGLRDETAARVAAAKAAQLAKEAPKATGRKAAASAAAA